MFEISFSAETFEEVKVKIQDFGVNHCNLQLRLKGQGRGRPKFSTEQHLQKPDVSYEELKASLRAVHDKLGEAICLQVLRKFEVSRLRDLPDKHWDRFLLVCKDYLVNA